MPLGLFVALLPLGCTPEAFEPTTSDTAPVIASRDDAAITSATFPDSLQAGEAAVATQLQRGPTRAAAAHRGRRCCCRCCACYACPRCMLAARAGARAWDRCDGVMRLGR